jgi:hypothetical protein
LHDRTATDDTAAGGAESSDLAPLGTDALYQYCPSCITARVHRSHARNFRERMRRKRSPERLFRCNQCGWRGWLMPLVSLDAEPVADLQTPDFSTLDEIVNTAAPPARPPFSPRNLQ